MTPTRRSPAGLLALVLASALAVVLAVFAADAAHAKKPKPKTCDISAVAEQLGPTRVTSLKVTKTDCAAGKKVVKAYHACRLKNGVSGRCVVKVKEYACREQRTTYPGQFSALVTCTKGEKTVTHRYDQVTS
jgi:hypothetical protein